MLRPDATGEFMLRRTSLLMLIVVPGVLHVTAQDTTSYKGMDYSLPAAWVSGEQDGQFVLAPADMTQENTIVVVLGGAEKLSGKTFDAWFRARLASELSPQVKLLQDSPVQSGTSGNLQSLSTGRTIQDASGGVRLQLYYAVSDGRQAGAAMLVTASDAAFNKYLAGVKALFASLRFSAAPQPAGPGDVTDGVGGAPANPGAAGARSSLSASNLAGYWTHSTSSYADYVSRSTGSYAGSSTIAYGQGYTFAADGTYQYSFTGMINSRYIKEKDSGKWELQGGNLVVRSRERNSTKVHQIVAFQTAPDGATFMTLLAADYPPTAGNIGLYGEKYMRQPPKAPVK